MGFDDAWSDAAEELIDVAREYGFPDWLDQEQRIAIGDVAGLVIWGQRWLDAIAGSSEDNEITRLIDAHFRREAPKLRALVAEIRTNWQAVLARRSELGWPDADPDPDTELA